MDEEHDDEIQLEDLISLAEAAALFPQVTQDALRRYAWSGRLQARKIGRNYVTTRRWVENYLNSRHRGSRTDLKNGES